MSLSHLLYPEGDFSFIFCNYTRMVMQHDYNVVKQNKLWDYLKKRSFDDSGFIYHMRQYDWWYQHTGMTLGISLKRMEYIAKYGWDAFVLTLD